jgi:hypothetical protein
MQAIMSKSSVVTQDMMATALNGLTVARLSMNVNTQNNSLTTQNLVCIYPYAVNVQIGYTVPQVVYIKNKYQDGTCQKNAILQHENGHVLINKNTAKALTVAIKQDIENLVNDPGYPFPVANKETGNELITALIQQHIDADWAQSRALNANLNGQLDTPENYRATTRLCPNW